MGHVGEEGGLGAVGLLGGLAGEHERGLVLLALGDVHLDDDVALDLAGGVEDGLAVEQEPERSAVLAVVEDLELEGLFGGAGGLFGGEGGGSGLGAHEKIVGVAADGLGGGVAGEAGETFVDPGDAAGGVGDDDAVERVRGDEREAAGLGLQALGLGQGGGEPAGEEITEAERGEDERHHEAEHGQHARPRDALDLGGLVGGEQGEAPEREGLGAPGPVAGAPRERALVGGGGADELPVGALGVE